MTLLGLVELSQTPKRAVRGLVLSVFAWPRACAELGSAEKIATLKMPAAMKRLLTRIELLPLETELKPSAYSITLLAIAQSRALLVDRPPAARAFRTMSLTSFINVGTWYGMPSLIVHSIPPPCTSFTFGSPGSRFPNSCSPSGRYTRSGATLSRLVGISPSVVTVPVPQD